MSFSVNCFYTEFIYICGQMLLVTEMECFTLELGREPDNVLIVITKFVQKVEHTFFYSAFRHLINLIHLIYSFFVLL